MAKKKKKWPIYCDFSHFTSIIWPCGRDNLKSFSHSLCKYYIVYHIKHVSILFNIPFISWVVIYVMTFVFTFFIIIRRRAIIECALVYFPACNSHTRCNNRVKCYKWPIILFFNSGNLSLLVRLTSHQMMLGVLLNNSEKNIRETNIISWTKTATTLPLPWHRLGCIHVYSYFVEYFIN